MSFEFSGAPALLGPSTGFSFATLPSNDSPASQNTPDNSSSFTFNAPSATSPFAASQSFGAAAKPTFGSVSSWLSASSPAPNASQTSNDVSRATSLVPSTRAVTPLTPEPEANDALSKALVRASKGRQAIFGRNEIAADGILKDIFENGKDGKPDVQALLAGMRAVESSSPEVAAFTRSLFGDLVRLRNPSTEEPAKETTPEVDDDNATEKLDSESESDSGDTRRSPPSQRSGHRWSIPRSHYRTKGLSAHLASVLLDEGHIWYEEGAKVLADYILDMFFDTKSNPDITGEVVKVLARDDNEDAIGDLMAWVYEKLDRINWVYIDNGEADNEPKNSNEDDILKDKKVGDDNRTSGETEQDTTTETSVKAETKPFRFLDLPPEMRNSVYRELLAPGSIGLYHKSRTNGREVVSSIYPQILETCRQVHDESKGILYEENTVCVPTIISSVGSCPVISKRLLPDTALSQLTSLVFVIDACDRREQERDEYVNKFHWKQFQDMTKLKELRIAMIERTIQAEETDSKRWILEQIIERVPASCSLSFETREVFDIDYAQVILDGIDRQRSSDGRVYASAYEVEEDELKTLAEPWKAKQGCKSGHYRDYRFPERSFTLKPLVATEAIDSSRVLGGGGAGAGGLDANTMLGGGQ